MKYQSSIAFSLFTVVLGAIGLRCAECGEPSTPILPAKLYRYTATETPGFVDDATLRRHDNTAKNNPLTDAGATLGRVLFYDRQLSRNNTISCGSCHHQKNSFTDPRQFSVGFDGRRTERNSMSIVNLRFTHVHENQPGFFWDERAKTLEALVLMPIEDQVEMGMKLPELEAKLQKLAYYPPLFRSAFGSPKVSSERIAKAVAQFMRSMVSLDSKFDRVAKVVGNNYSRDFPDFSAAENLGKSLFIDGLDGVTEIGCVHCHVPPTFAMPQSFNVGLDLVSRDKGLGARGVPSNDPFTPSNDGKFKASPLRNVALTAPYMHDGRFKTLEQVIDHYSDGVHPNPNLGLAVAEDDDLKVGSKSGFKYTAKQKAGLVAFLKTLTDEKFINDPRFSDPFARKK